MKAVLYTRVSTDEQGESGYSLPSQLEACTRYAEDHHLEIVGCYSDDFTGAVPIESRPEGRKAYAMLQSGAADALIVYRIDRLVRPPAEGDEWEFPLLIRGLAKIGREIHTVNRGRIGTSFADLLLAMLESKNAGDERRAIIERTSRGRRTKAKAGKVVGNGSPLFGYTYSDGQYIVNEAEAATVRLMFDLYVHRRLSMWQVADHLNTQRILTRSGALWNETGIYRRLADPAYAGRWRYAGISVTIPAIVDGETFDMAAQVRGDNRNYARRNAHDVYLLRGMIHCDCGCRGKFYGVRFTNKRGTNYYYYSSLYSHGRESRLAKRSCHERNIRASVVEQYAWEYAAAVIQQDDDALTAALLRVADDAHDARTEHAAQLAEVDADIAEAESEAERLAAQLSVGGVVGSKVTARIAAVNMRHAALLKRRAEIAARAEQPLTARRIAGIVELRRALGELLSNPSPERKRAAFEMMRLVVRVKGGHGTISSVFPFVTEALNLHPC